MAKNRNTFRHHIRAAREWLGRAENSLDKENDIRGDLNLMLAQAELQRAKESKGLAAKPSWWARLAPVAMAMLLVGGCFACFRLEQPAPAPLTAAESPVSAIQASREDKVPVQPEAASVQAAAPATSAAVPIVSAAAVEPKIPQPEKVPHIQSVEPAVVQPAARVPSAHMQKLMQAAGRSLRAQ